MAKAQTSVEESSPKRRVRTLRGAWGVLYIVYLVFVALNATAIWFLIRTGLAVVMRRPKPRHRDFIETLLRCLNPVILACPPSPGHGCVVLANHVNWSDFVIDICARAA